MGVRSAWSFTGDLHLVQTPPRIRVEGIAVVHGEAIVPDHKIAHLPAVRPDTLVLHRMRPQFIEQRLAFFDLKADDPGAEASPEIQALAAAVRDGAHNRMNRPRRPGDIAHFVEGGPC